MLALNAPCHAPHDFTSHRARLHIASRHASAVRPLHAVEERAQDLNTELRSGDGGFFTPGLVRWVQLPLCTRWGTAALLF